MFLRRISLTHFKNHEALSLQFDTKINCLIGKNGVGKTNLLDAIYYLCLTKSYFHSNDQQNIYSGKDFFRLEGDFTKDKKSYSLVYKLLSNRKKELQINDDTLSRFSQHVGNFPAIMIAPDDNSLITGNSEDRRRFLDNTISQINPEYLNDLMQYNKILAQRNAALRNFSETGITDHSLLEIYDRQLIPLGMAIHKLRHETIELLSPIFKNYHKLICMEYEAAEFTYQSQLNEMTFDVLLKNSLKKDLLLQRTDSGIHRDDLEFLMNGSKIKRFGSQGQQKSFIISMKFAQYEFIKQRKNYPPILLIDDIFDKLDDHRSQKLVELISTDQFGQVFVTDTGVRHIREVLKGKEDIYTVIEF